MKKWQQLAIGGAGAGILSLAIIQPWEGGNVHRAYYDRIGHVWTICDGHTKGVHAGDTATDSECQAFLAEDTGDARQIVRKCIKVPLNPNEEAAFTSATFNLGAQVVCGSTLQALANEGNVEGACLQLTDATDRKGNYVGWTRGGGKEIAGLRNRRTEERNLCLGYYR